MFKYRPLLQSCGCCWRMKSLNESNWDLSSSHFNLTRRLLLRLFQRNSKIASWHNNQGNKKQIVVTDEGLSCRYYNRVKGELMQYKSPINKKVFRVCVCQVCVYFISFSAPPTLLISICLCPYPLKVTYTDRRR